MIPLSSLAYRWGMGLNRFLIFMSSYTGLGPKKAVFANQNEAEGTFPQTIFSYAENLLYELLSIIHRINCSTLDGCTKIRPLTCCVIS